MSSVSLRAAPSISVLCSFVLPVSASAELSVSRSRRRGFLAHRAFCRCDLLRMAASAQRRRGPAPTFGGQLMPEFAALATYILAKCCFTLSLRKKVGQHSKGPSRFFIKFVEFLQSLMQKQKVRLATESCIWFRRNLSYHCWNVFSSCLLSV